MLKLRCSREISKFKRLFSAEALSTSIKHLFGFSMNRAIWLYSHFTEVTVKICFLSTQRLLFTPHWNSSDRLHEMHSLSISFRLISEPTNSLFSSGFSLESLSKSLHKDNRKVAFNRAITKPHIPHRSTKKSRRKANSIKCTKWKAKHQTYCTWV